jgi:hypothetical protein
MSGQRLDPDQPALLDNHGRAASGSAERAITGYALRHADGHVMRLICNAL